MSTTNNFADICINNLDILLQRVPIPQNSDNVKGIEFYNSCMDKLEEVLKPFVSNPQNKDDVPQAIALTLFKFGGLLFDKYRGGLDEYFTKSTEQFLKLFDVSPSTVDTDPKYYGHYIEKYHFFAELIHGPSSHCMGKKKFAEFYREHHSSNPFILYIFDTVENYYLTNVFDFEIYFSIKHEEHHSVPAFFYLSSTERTTPQESFLYTLRKWLSLQKHVIDLTLSGDLLFAALTGIFGNLAFPFTLPSSWKREATLFWSIPKTYKKYKEHKSKLLEGVTDKTSQNVKDFLSLIKLP